MRGRGRLARTWVREFALAEHGRASCRGPRSADIRIEGLWGAGSGATRDLHPRPCSSHCASQCRSRAGGASVAEAIEKRPLGEVTRGDVGESSASDRRSRLRAPDGVLEEMAPTKQPT